MWAPQDGLWYTVWCTTLNGSLLGRQVKQGQSHRTAQSCCLFPSGSKAGKPQTQKPALHNSRVNEALEIHKTALPTALQEAHWQEERMLPQQLQTLSLPRLPPCLQPGPSTSPCFQGIAPT